MSRDAGESANVSRESGALGSRRGKSRRRRKRFDGTQEIQEFCRLDRRLDPGWRDDHNWRGQHKRHGTDHRAFRIMAARHRARHHSGHVMSAIHMIRRRSRSFLVMMSHDRALIRRAARGLVGRPYCTCQWRIKENDNEQANACRDRPPALVTWYFHSKPNLRLVEQYYGVKRHSLQAPIYKVGWRVDWCDVFRRANLT